MKKIITLMFVYLIVSLPITLAQYVGREPTSDPVIKDDDTGRSASASLDIGGGELNVEVIGPTSKRDIDIDKNLTITGEDVFAGDFVINVKRYEPTILTSSLVEETSAPVYAFISGWPLGLGGGISNPIVSSMSLSVIGGNANYIAGTPKWNPPTVFTADNLGYIETRVKKIPREEDVPNRIDIKLRARIRYEGEVTAPVFGGKEIKRFKENRDLDIFEQGNFIDLEYEVFGGRGYIRVSRITGNSATFDVYGYDGVFKESVIVGLGQESNAINLVSQTNFDEDMIRIRLDRIIRADDTVGVFEIGDKSYRHNRYSVYSVIGRTGFDPYSNFQNNGIAGSEWVVKEFFIPDSWELGSRKFVALENVNLVGSEGSEVVLIEGFDETAMRNWYKTLYEFQSTGDGNNAKRLVDSLRSSAGEGVSESLKSQGIGSIDAANFLLDKLPSITPEVDHVQRIDDLFDSFKRSFNGEFPLLREILEGESEKAVLSVGGEIPQTFVENQEIKVGTPCNDNSGDHYCRLESVSGNQISIVRYERQQDGNCKAGARDFATLSADIINQRRARLIPREAGQLDIPETTRVSSEEGLIDSRLCGATVELLDIATDNEVEVTLLSGRKLGYSEAIFDLHIPIEKRAIKLAPEKIDDKINSTKELIADLDNMIEKLEKFVGTWSKVCLGVSAWFTIEAFLVGIPKYKQQQGQQELSYTAEFEDGYEYTLTKGNNVGKTVTINGIKDGVYYYKNAEDKIVLIDELDSYGAIDKDGVAYEYDPLSKKLKPKSKLNEELNAASLRTLPDGKQEIAFGTGSLSATKDFIRRFSSPEYATRVEEDLKPYGNQGFYTVFREGEYVKICQKRGDEVDGGESYGGSAIDNCPVLVPKTGATAEDRNIYSRMENEFRLIRRAQLQGRQSAFFGGRNFKINDLGAVPETDLKCQDILGEGKCKILFNACDPVVCPRSRCNLGGQYHEIGPSGVIGSGLVGSLVLCLPNIKQERGGVIVPICLSGILASLKGIRSHLESYVACLEKQKIDGVSTGICDQMRSIFICSIIWKEALTLLSAKRGLVNFFGGSNNAGGGEYFQKGIGGSLEQANEVAGFIINDYADDVFSAYRGKGLPEIGAEICKASIAQRIPFMDALVQELGTPENPPQFTAYFEEKPFAPTLGKSQYTVYYHIYAGTPRRNIVLQYIVYLKSFGSSPRIVVNSGGLGSGESADESIDLVGDQGYQEICVGLNGLEQCGFGKIVSSSFFLSTLDDYLTSVDLARNIDSAEKCKADNTAGISYSLTTSNLPAANIVRVCSLSNPGVGRGEDRYWKKIGTCGQDNKGESLGNCWAFADTSRLSETERQALNNICNGQICQSNEECMNGDQPGKVIYTDTRGNSCCEIGQCTPSQEYNTARKLGDNVLNNNDRKSRLNEFLKTGFDQSGNPIDRAPVDLPSSAEDWFYIGSRYCAKDSIINWLPNQDPFVTCKNIFDKYIARNHGLYSQTRYLLGIYQFNADNLNDAKRYLEEAISGSLGASELNDANQKLGEIKIKENEDEQRRQKEKAVYDTTKSGTSETPSTEGSEEKPPIGESGIDGKIEEDNDKFNEWISEIDSLIERYKGFSNIITILNQVKGQLNGAIRLKDYNENTKRLDDVLEKLKIIQMVEDTNEFNSVEDDLHDTLNEIEINLEWEEARNYLVDTTIPKLNQWGDSFNFEILKELSEYVNVANDHFITPTNKVSIGTEKLNNAILIMQTNQGRNGEIEILKIDIQSYRDSRE